MEADKREIAISEKFILPDMLDKKADKHPTITSVKKKYFWDWLSTPKNNRLPTTKSECAVRLGVTIQTLSRWRDDWLQAQKAQSLMEVHTTPSEVTAMLEKKLAEIQPLVEKDLDLYSHENPKQALADVSNFVLWNVLGKGSLKLMKMVDNVEDPEVLIKIMDKAINIIKRIDDTGVALVENGKAFIKTKKTVSVSQELLAGCNFPKEEPKEVIEAEVVVLPAESSEENTDENN